jgi:hypothetical protein
MNRQDYVTAFAGLWIIFHVAKDMEYNVKEHKEWRHLFVPFGIFAAYWILFPVFFKLLTTPSH